MHKRFLALMFVMIFLISFVSSAPPITSITTAGEKFIIEPTIKDYIKTGQNHSFAIHVSNSTSGHPITSGIGCYMHLYNSDGSHEFEGFDSTVDHVFDYEFDLTGENFSTRGFYQAKFQCNDSEFGGSTEIEFAVNDYGEELTEGRSFTFNMMMVFMMILFILGIIGIFSFDDYAGKLACYWVSHVLFVVGTFSVWQFNMGYAIGFVGLANVYKILFWVSTIAMFPMILLSLAWIFYIHTMNDTIKGFMDRGMDEDVAIKKARRKNKW